MTLAQLSITVALLAALGLVASRIGLSAIPAYLLAGLLLGPNEPRALSLIRPSEVTDFVAEIGLVFLLFFLGLEFTLGRLVRTRQHAVVGGAIDLLTNVVIGLVLGFASGGGGAAGETLSLVGKAIAFVAVALAISKWLSEVIDRLLDWLPREFFLLAVFAFLMGAAALAKEVGLSEAIGALMAGVVLSETSVRADIEERFFSFRDVFAALFFFVFGLSINVGKLGSVGWILAAAAAAAVVGKVAGGYLAGLVGGVTRRESFNAGVALVAHGEVTIIL